MYETIKRLYLENKLKEVNIQKAVMLEWITEEESEKILSLNK